MILKPILLARAMTSAILPTAISSIAKLATTPPAATSVLHRSVIATLRGGAATVVDLERASLRLEGLDSYAVIASIVLGAVMNVYQSCPKKNLTQRQEKVAQWVHALSTATSTLCGLYVIMVFSLFNLYAKTALGTGADHVYLQLLEATTAMRRMGFQAFILLLVNFEVALVANLFLNFKGRARWLFSGCCAVGTVICLKEWMFVMKCASKCIFQ
jgi:hypothetical protein